MKNGAWAQNLALQIEGAVKAHGDDVAVTINSTEVPHATWNLFAVHLRRTILEWQP